MDKINIRHIEPTDYPFVVSIVNEWWGGRNMSGMLPKLFFIHFRQTSFVAEHGGKIVGFLVGFLSQTYSTEAYIHFAGVHPGFRKKGLGRALYERFFETVKKAGCRTVHCVTSPVNQGSVSFHRSMGFMIEPGGKDVDGVPVSENYDGTGGDRVLFYKNFCG